MPTYNHHFTPLYPPVPQEELENLMTLGSMEFQTVSGLSLPIRLLGRPHRIDVLAVTVPAEADIGDVSRWLEQIVECAISAMRLGYDPGTMPIYGGDGFVNMMAPTDDEEPSYQVAIAHPENRDYRVDAPAVLQAMAAISNPKVAPIAALLAEGQFAPIPPHYRVLSLFRAIEVLFPDQQVRSARLDTYQTDFAALSISTRPFRNALPEIRTRCAHGAPGRDAKPYAGVGYNQQPLIKLCLLLRRIVGDGLREMHGIETRIGDGEPGDANQAG